jgi:hypothetical protein
MQILRSNQITMKDKNWMLTSDWTVRSPVGSLIIKGRIVRTKLMYM